MGTCLDVFADHRGELRPVLPVLLVERVLDRHDRVAVGDVGVHRHELVARQLHGGVLVRAGGLEVQVVSVLARDLELRRGDV